MYKYRLLELCRYFYSEDSEAFYSAFLDHFKIVLANYQSGDKVLDINLYSSLVIANVVHFTCLYGKAVELTVVIESGVQYVKYEDQVLMTANETTVTINDESFMQLKNWLKF